MKLKRLLAAVLAAAVCGMMAGCGDTDSSSKADSGSGSSTADSQATESGAEQKEKDDTIKPMRDITAWELVKEMKTGWNLGNTFDATGSDGLSAETSWGQPTTTKLMVDAVADAGFNVFRLPVSWGKHMDDKYQVDQAWMDRVREVVDYAIDDGMFVILNTHHEDWYFPKEEDKEQDIEQLKALWAQIAEEFKGYDEHLIFEGLNEPRLRDTPQEWTGGTPASREIVNEYEKAFYDTVRASGGNNDKRALMISGYAASSDPKVLNDIKLPDENDKHLIVSVHAYLPYSFALDTKGTDQFDAASDGGVIDSLFDNLDNIFLSKEIPVIIGEYGSMNKNFNVEDRVECVKYYLEAAKEKGVPCVWWDNNAFVGNGENFGLLSRNSVISDNFSNVWDPQEIIDAIKGVYNE